MTKDITNEQAEFKDFKQPEEKAIMVTNPPYGERISTPDLLGTYKMIGEKLKHQFKDNEAWVLSYREECFDQIGLKPSIKIPLYNGSLECEFRKYQIFEGRLKEFRSEGNIMKTEEEKKAMAEKHRFKKNREFKKRIDEEEENEEGDIRTFKFHSMSFKKEKDDFNRSGRKREYEGSGRDSRRRGRDDYGRNQDFKERNGQFRGRRDFDKKGKRFNNEK